MYNTKHPRKMKVSSSHPGWNSYGLSPGLIFFCKHIFRHVIMHISTHRQRQPFSQSWQRDSRKFGARESCHWSSVLVRECLPARGQRRWIALAELICRWSLRQRGTRRLVVYDSWVRRASARADERSPGLAVCCPDRWRTDHPIGATDCRPRRKVAVSRLCEYPATLQLPVSSIITFM